MPGALPPPPAVGYDVSDEEGEALENKMSLSGSGFDVNDMGKKPRKAAAPVVSAGYCFEWSWTIWHRRAAAGATAAWPFAQCACSAGTHT